MAKKRVERTCCLCNASKRTTQTKEQEPKYSCESCEAKLAERFKTVAFNNNIHSYVSNRVMMIHLDSMKEKYVERKWFDFWRKK